LGIDIHLKGVSSVRECGIKLGLGTYV